MDYPDTIHSPEVFNQSLPAGFDGVFNWAWTKGCFGNTIITPMDFDGVVERHGHFIVFETKNVGAVIPRGQMITLTALQSPKTFCVMQVWGKSIPCFWKASFGWINKPVHEAEGQGVESAKDYVARWYRWADEH